MAFPIKCGCGKVLQVTAGDAGATLTCDCGRSVEVPSLSKLRQAAGQSTASPELIIESMLRNNELPQDEHCVDCQVATDVIQHFSVTCEQAETKKPVSGCGWLFLALLGWIGVVCGMIVNRDSGLKEFGRNIHYRLPLRICSRCGERCRMSDLKELLSEVPVYAHLLDKYPHAKIRVCD